MSITFEIESGQKGVGKGQKTGVGGLKLSMILMTCITAHLLLSY